MLAALARRRGGAASLAVGLYLAWFVAPADYQQGETVRIMFVHVPAAWLAMFFYSVMASRRSARCSGATRWRTSRRRRRRRSGATFALVCLVTGSLWGKPMWGTYWVWDARLTSMLILFLMYCGIVALWRTIEEPARAARAVSILTLVGVVNMPIIKFSVDWWNTLHQPASVLRMGGPTIHPSMLYPLLVMALGFTAARRDAAHRRRCAPRSCAGACGRLAILEAERLDGAFASRVGPHAG